MPVFNQSPTGVTGAPRFNLNQLEAARTLGGQVASLTFMERARPRARMGDLINHPLGLLLESATNSLMYAGVTKRTVPRFQIGSRSGREFQQQIAASGGQGQLTLVYNPSLRLHQELTQPPLDAQYHIASFQAPPYMNCVAGVYDHIASDPVTLSGEDQPLMPVTMLDNYGAEHIPGRFYQSRGEVSPPGQGESGFDFKVEMQLVPGQTESPLIVARATADGAPLVWQPGSITLTFEDSGGNIVLKGVSGAADPTQSGYDAFRILFLLHIPGAAGGYVLGPATVGASNQRVNFTTDVNFVVDDPTSRGALVKRIRAQTAPSLYLGVYATPTENLVVRDDSIV